MPGPAPVPTPETLPYWEAAARGQLRIQYCTACATYYFFPRAACPHCGSADVEWRTVSGRARLVSYAINQRPLPPFDPRTPFVVAVVQLEEGPRMMTNIVDVEPVPDALPLDAPLTVRFDERGEWKVPVFALAEAAA